MQVDFELQGCPINKHQLLEVIGAFLAERRPAIPSYSVCMECKRRGNVCVMVAHGTPCLGPVTHAGCGALCPAHDRGCYGCFGPMETPNTASLSGWMRGASVPRPRTWCASTATSTETRRPFARRARRASEASMSEGNGGTRRIETGYLARVEGEGAMVVRVRGDEVLGVELRIFEPPRLFEALLRGRALGEAPDITARICGICPVAYQTSACEAMEDALGIEVTGQLRNLRRLIYCGEWIQSHALHLYMLHAPDFLGYESGFAMARDHRAEVERGLRAKKAGNRLIATVGGREVHPINLRVGGFYRAPERRELEPLRTELERGRSEALETVRWVAGLELP